MNAKISKIGNEDKAHYNRHLQWNQHYRQADEAIELISSEIDSMDAIPEEEEKLWQETKAKWEEAKEQESSVREELSQCKQNVQREKSATQAEALAVQQRNERLQVRATKLNDQLERLRSATNHDQSERQRIKAEQAARATDRQQIEDRNREQIAQFQRSIQEVQYHTQQCRNQAQMLESAFHQPALVAAASPADRLTPEREASGTPAHPATSTVSGGFRFPAFSSQDYSTNVFGNRVPSRSETRPRSRSLLSNNSVYMDFPDQDSAPPIPPSRVMEATNERQFSGSSGSGSVGSYREPISPSLVGTPKKSPVGNRSSPVWN